MLAENGCHVVAKWIAGAPRNLPLFQLGLNLAEAEMFHKMPVEMRDGYRLAKILKHSDICPEIDGISVDWFITSYMLKTCIFHLYSKESNG